MNEPLKAAINTINDSPGEDDRVLLAKAKARAQLIGYDSRWSEQTYRATRIESEFLLPITNPATGALSRTFQQAGKIDVELMDGTRALNMDHKTSSMDIGDPASTFWRQLAVESQVNMYALACWQQGNKVDGSVWDVIRKPTIRPAKIKAAPKVEPDRRGTVGEIVERGTYFGFKVSAFDRQYVSHTPQENPNLYQWRLTADCLERPSHYYQRQSVPRLDHEMIAWAEELWIIAQDIRQTQLRSAKCENPEIAWFRNSGSCMNYNTPCEYLGLCSGCETPDNGLWMRRETPHAELAVASDGERWDVLTHSSIRTYQTCRRKAFYRYELRLQRLDEEERDALFYGSLIHKALETWWSFYKEEDV